MSVDGAFIYPRLDREAARRLLTEMSTLTLAELEDRASLSHPDAAPRASGGPHVPREVLGRLQGNIRAVAAEEGYPVPLRRGYEQGFEQECGGRLLRDMGIVVADAASDGVWSFLSLVVVPEIGPWRFPDRNSDRLVGRPRNVLRRLWWRAWVLEGIAVPPGRSPLGEDELVQVMERPTIAGSPRVAQALVRGLWRAEGQAGAARSEVMRQMARRLLGRMAYLSLEVLSDVELDALVDDVAAESMVALRRPM